MPAARANSTFGLTGPVNPPHRSWGMRRGDREAVTGIGRRWRAGAPPQRADAREQGGPALRGEAGPAKHARTGKHAGAGMSSRRRRRGGSRGEESGFTLVEMIIAFAILMIVLVPVASVLANSISQAASSRERLTALSLAEQYVEKYSNSVPPTTATGRVETGTTVPGTPPHQLLSGVIYTVMSRFRWVANQGSPNLCATGVDPTSLEVHVTVTWSNGAQHVADTSILNYPPAGLPQDGFLAVQLNGDPAKNPPVAATTAKRTWKTRVTKVPVKITSTHFTQTVKPTPYGCVFEQLLPGTYTVSISSPNTTLGATVPSWVENADERTAVPPTSFTITAGQVTSTSYQYDEGSLVSIGYPSSTATDGGTTCPSAGKIQCLVAGQAPSAASKPTSTALTDLSVRTSAGWTVLTPPITRVAGIACSGTTRCIAVGYQTSSGAAVGTSVSSAATTTTPSFTADAVPPGVTTFTHIRCPAATSTCFATALGGTGGTTPMVLSATVSPGGVSWTTDTVTAPTVLTTLSSLSCPGATDCVATGTTASGPVVLSLSPSGAWTADTLPPSPAPSTTGLGQVACPAATKCFVLGSTTSGAEILSLAKTTSTTTSGGTMPKPPAWVADSLPATPTVSQLSRLTCPSATVCYAIGSQVSGATTTGAVLSVTAASLTTTTPSWVLDSVPVTPDLTDITCATPSWCVALGMTTTGPTLLQRTAPTAWAAWTPKLPAGAVVRTLSGATCSTSAECFVAATLTTSGTPAATIASSVSGAAWNLDSLPAGLTPVAITGISCTSTTCVASGTSETAAFILAGASSNSWSTTTPGALADKGLHVADPPITIAAATLQTSSPLVDTPAAGTTEIGPLFPLASGYSVAAADCTAESTSASTHVSTAPGATTSAVLPLGMLPIRVTNAHGIPVADATVSVALAATSTCRPLLPLPTRPADPSGYGLETTGPLGLSVTDVIYDTYLVTVTAPGGTAATATVKVTPTSTTEAGTTAVTGGTGITRPLSQPVPVTVT